MSETQQTTTLLPAIIGFFGVLVGASVQVLGNILNDWRKQKAEYKKDEARRNILKKMLSDDRFEWRKLDTLMHVIGSDPETTKRLLLEIGGRASEDGQNLWGLIEKHPLGKEKP
jgi:hypothetical protein